MITDEFYHVTPISSSPLIQTEVPGSKSITNRALLLAALADGTSTINGTLFSDDSRHFLNCLIELGFPVQIEEASKTVHVTGFHGKIPKKEAAIYVGSAGTAARFLTAMLGLSDGVYHLNASEQMKKRPMKPLLDSLESIGTKIVYQEKEGYFPFTIYGNSNSKAFIQVDIANSSQFLSALLMSAPMKKEGLTIELTGGSHALSYVKITTKMMEQFGCQVVQKKERLYQVLPNQSYKACHYQVEPDVSAACYFYAMAPLLNTKTLVRKIHPDSMQGDIRFLSILKEMGCTFADTADGILVSAPVSGKYKGITVDMGDCSDQTMTLSSIAPFADGPVKIRGIEHIRFQESNRIQAICKELNRMGISCKEAETGIDILPGIPQPATIETYDDHRMAMAFSLIGLRVPGIIIAHPACCKKTFENYFEILDTITKSHSLSKPDSIHPSL